MEMDDSQRSYGSSYGRVPAPPGSGKKGKGPVRNSSSKGFSRSTTREEIYPSGSYQQQGAGAPMSSTSVEPNMYPHGTYAGGPGGTPRGPGSSNYGNKGGYSRSNSRPGSMMSKGGGGKVDPRPGSMMSMRQRDPSTVSQYRGGNYDYQQQPPSYSSNAPLARSKSKGKGTMKGSGGKMRNKDSMYSARAGAPPPPPRRTAQTNLKYNAQEQHQGEEPEQTWYEWATGAKPGEYEEEPPKDRNHCRWVTCYLLIPVFVAVLSICVVILLANVLPDKEFIKRGMQANNATAQAPVQQPQPAGQLVPAAGGGAGPAAAANPPAQQGPPAGARNPVPAGGGNPQQQVPPPGPGVAPQPAGGAAPAQPPARAHDVRPGDDDAFLQMP
mmetsp:Transcript_10587/g.25803  ORF Transcript_10587/g.25803 Transcript_10587/m.25803 type:complete len:383 (+) Transcript_10587:186-1334(+)